MPQPGLSVPSSPATRIVKAANACGKRGVIPGSKGGIAYGCRPYKAISYECGFSIADSLS